MAAKDRVHKEDIVLGFQIPEMRKYTDYAIVKLINQAVDFF